MKSNSVTTLIMNGKIQIATNFQEELFLKYQQKYQDKIND
jgi:hypothetical protein